MPWQHCTDSLGAHSPFNTVHNWARGGLIEWVCGFLLTLQGPLHPTPAHKQIKLQFHHLEGAVSCPNSSPQPPTFHIYTGTQNSTPLPHQSGLAPPPPKCQPLSTAQLQGGMKGFEGRKRERGGWVVREAKGIGSMHGDLIAVSSLWNILLWRKCRRGRGDRKATLLRHLDTETPDPYRVLHASLTIEALCRGVFSFHSGLWRLKESKTL